MEFREWIADDDGIKQSLTSYRIWDLLQESYYFYRFLADVDDILLAQTHTDIELNSETYLGCLRKLVRKFVLNSYWLQTQIPQLCPPSPVTVLNLYDELGFPLTVQTVTFAPEFVSTIHNHGTWGVVAILKGQEKNTFWRQSCPENDSSQIILLGQQILKSGDIISFTPGAIHQIESISDEPLVTFNIYGETQANQRFEFDLIRKIRKKY